MKLTAFILLVFLVGMICGAAILYILQNEKPTRSQKILKHKKRKQIPTVQTRQPAAYPLYRWNGQNYVQAQP